MKIAIIDSGFYNVDSLIFKPLNNINNSDSVHGTAVAGIIGSKKTNTFSFQGLIPGIEIYIYDIPESNLNISSLVTALESISQYKFDIINISLGAFQDDPELFVAVKKTIENGSLIVASAGNNSLENYNYPASYDIPGVISVGALDQEKNIASFSTVNDKIDLYLDGVNVSSISLNNKNRYTGTSYATPIATAFIAMIKSKCKNYTPAELEKIISYYTFSYSGYWKGMKKRITILDYNKIINTKSCIPN